MEVDTDEDNKEFIVGTLHKSPEQPLQRQSCHNRVDPSSPDNTTPSSQLDPGGIELLAPSKTTEQSEHGSGTQGKSVIHQIIHNQAYGDSVAMHGDLGVVPQGARGHYFTKNDSHDDSLMMLGSITTEFAVESLKARFAVRGRGKAALKRAASASSTKGVTKR